MNKAPAFQWYPKDCDTDEKVRMMDDEHFGFYVRCLNHAWLNYGLPENLSDIAMALGRRPSKVIKLWEKVGICFELLEKRWVNVKQEEQRKTVREFVESRRKAAVTRWEQRDAKKELDARASENGCKTDARGLHVQCSASASASANTPPKPPEGEVVNQFETTLAVVAKEIHDRHPKSKHTVAGITIITKKLRTICAKLHGQTKIDKLLEINVSHTAHCQSDDWVRGFHSKLENWLAPTEMRWESTAPQSDESETLWDHPAECMVVRENDDPMKFYKRSS